MKISFYVSVILFGAISAVPMRGDLLVIPADNGNSSPAVLRFDERTGAFINQFGHETEGYEGIALSRDGKIYVTSNILGYGDVHHFNRDGQYQGGFTNGNLRTPGRLAFGPDGNCYVLGSSWPNTPERWQILRYNGATGLFKDTFITNAGMPRDLAFGTDGRLYVADASRGIVRYHGTTGAFIDTFAALASGKGSGQRWHLDLGRPISRLVAADLDGDGRMEVLFGGDDGKLHALVERDGKPRLLWSVGLGRRVGEPVLADLDGDGRPEVLVAAEDGRLYCLKGK